MIDNSLQAPRASLLRKKACGKVCRGTTIRLDRNTLSLPFGVNSAHSRLKTIRENHSWLNLKTEWINYFFTMEFEERNPFETGKLLVCEIAVTANLNFTLYERRIFSFKAVIVEGM